MKFQRTKDILTGVIISALVITMGTTAFAKVSKMNIIANYNNIKIVVDGKELKTDKEPFIYDGTTYLPVRAVGEAVGKTVSWDGNTNTVTLSSSEKTSTSSTSNTQTATIYSRTNPAPVNTVQTYTKNSKYGSSYTVSLRVAEVYRGASAWEKVKAANMFNDEAPAGKEYIVAKLVATVITSEEDKAIDFSTYSFTPFSGSNVEYEMALAVAPDPVFGGSVYAGGTTEGYGVFLVDKNDANPKIVYGQNYDGTGGVWFSLTK